MDLFDNESETGAYSDDLYVANDGEELTFVEDALDDHQVRLGDRLASSLKKGVGQLLCTPVGCGKSRTALYGALTAAEVPRLLVLAPKTLLEQWKEEYEDLVASGPPWVVFHGRGRSLEVALSEGGAVVVTTPETFRSDTGSLLRPAWTAFIVDELHRFRSPDSQTYRALTRLRAPGVGLTATPVVREAAEDLANLVRVVHRDARPCSLGAMVGQYVVTATRVELGLRTPVVRTSCFYVGLDEPEELARYREVVGKLDKALKRFMRHQVSAAANAAYRRTAAFRSALRKYVVALNEVKVASSYYPLHDVLRKVDETKEGFRPRLDGSGNGEARRAVLEERQRAVDRVYEGAPLTAKLRLVLDKLRQLHEAAVPVLLFSDFVVPIEVLARHMSRSGVPAAVVTGSTSRSERDRQLAWWKEGADVHVLLLSKAAGGVGLNLERAAHAIFLDTPWNPQTDKQAIGRMDRRNQVSDELHESRVVYPGSFDVARFSVFACRENQLQLGLGRGSHTESSFCSLGRSLLDFEAAFAYWKQVESHPEPERSQLMLQFEKEHFARTPGVSEKGRKKRSRGG